MHLWSFIFHKKDLIINQMWVAFLSFKKAEALYIILIPFNFRTIC